MNFYINYIAAPHKLGLYEISRSHSSVYRNYSLLGLVTMQLSRQVPTSAETCTVPWIGRYSVPSNVDTHKPNYNKLHPAIEFNLNHACPRSFFTHTLWKRQTTKQASTVVLDTQQQPKELYPYVRGHGVRSQLNCRLSVCLSVSGHLNPSMQMLLPLPSTFSHSVNGK
jgi:hypothetical protein